MIGEDLTEGLFEQRCEGSKGASHVDTPKNIRLKGGGKRECRNVEAETLLACLRTSRRTACLE